MSPTRALLLLVHGEWQVFMGSQLTCTEEPSENKPWSIMEFTLQCPPLFEPPSSVEPSSGVPTLPGYLDRHRVSNLTGIRRFFSREEAMQAAGAQDQVVGGSALHPVYCSMYATNHCTHIALHVVPGGNSTT